MPVFWQVLKKMFTDDPEIVVDIVGDKVVIGGYTANVDTLRRVDTAKALDPSRIVTQVSYSTAQIAELVKDFLSRAAVTNIGVNVVGREVCLSGRSVPAPAGGRRRGLRQGLPRHVRQHR